MTGPNSARVNVLTNIMSAGGGDPQGALHFKCNDGYVTLLLQSLLVERLTL